jgi:hypothetical protein
MSVFVVGPSFILSYCHHLTLTKIKDKRWRNDKEGHQVMTKTKDKPWRNDKGRCQVTKITKDKRWTNDKDLIIVVTWHLPLLFLQGLSLVIVIT